MHLLPKDLFKANLCVTFQGIYSENVAHGSTDVTALVDWYD